MLDKSLEAALAFGIHDIKPVKSSKQLFIGYLEEKDILLKLFSCAKTCLQEKEALLALSTSVSPNVIYHSIEQPFLVLESIHPGVSLYDVAKKDETSAIEIFIHLLQRIPKIRATKFAFSPFTNLLSSVENHSSLSKEILIYAKRVIKKIENFPSDSYLIHGNLSLDNILFSQHKGWMCISPFGLMGNSYVEAAPFLLSTDSTPSLEVLFKRISMLQKHLNLDPSMLKYYAFLRSILDSIWDSEHKEKVHRFSHIWTEQLLDCMSFH
ncbi:MAG: hypothetical protein EBZ47_01565 [Chlamydiae bacterium]|nr:hypothetical protein [Chlamydiota bacterium]